MAGNARFRDDHNPALFFPEIPEAENPPLPGAFLNTGQKPKRSTLLTSASKDVATDSQIDDIEALVVKYILSLPGRDFVVSKLPTSKPLVLIFDGLDEYAARGPKSKKAAWGLLGIHTSIRTALQRSLLPNQSPRHFKDHTASRYEKRSISKRVQADSDSSCSLRLLRK